MTPAHLEMVYKELLRGHKCANELQIVIGKSMERGQDLVNKILDSFKNSFSILKSFKNSLGSLPTTEGSGNCFRGQEKPGDSNIKSTGHSGATAKKRRKKETPVTDVGLGLLPDGYAWRKYGHKVISKFTFPREYYRCSYKKETECQASKQVQKLQDDPPLYRTTYHGNHSCNVSIHNNVSNVKDITMLDSYSASSSNESNFSSSSVLLTFDGPRKQIIDASDLPSVPMLSVSDDNGLFPNDSWLSDYPLPPNLELSESLATDQHSFYEINSLDLSDVILFDS